MTDNSIQKYYIPGQVKKMVFVVSAIVLLTILSLVAWKISDYLILSICVAFLAPLIIGIIFTFKYLKPFAELSDLEVKFRFPEKFIIKLAEIDEIEIKNLPINEVQTKWKDFLELIAIILDILSFFHELGSDFRSPKSTAPALIFKLKQADADISSNFKNKWTQADSNQVCLILPADYKVKHYRPVLKQIVKLNPSIVLKK